MAEKRYRRLDEGELLGALAAGTYGRVYAAWDTHTGTTVAVERQELPHRVAARELCLLKALRSH
jgi:serine/threonine protein kinase